MSDKWPNHDSWAAGQHEVTVKTGDGNRYLWVVSCGMLWVPSGKLAVCDPFGVMLSKDNAQVQVPVGTFPVRITLADVSDSQDRGHIREAYASIYFADAEESYRRVLPLLPPGAPVPELEEDEFIGAPVIAGTLCFVDDSVIHPCMPPEDTWLEDLFDNPGPESWFSRMDDPDHIREGLANIPLPLAQHGENLILFHSGWGDGRYPVVGSFDSHDRLLAVHVDLLVVP